MLILEILQRTEKYKKEEKITHIQSVTYILRTKDNLTLLTVCILAEFELLQSCSARQSCTLILFCSWHSTIISGITWGLCMFVFPTTLDAPRGEEQCCFNFSITSNGPAQSQARKDASSMTMCLICCSHSYCGILFRGPLHGNAGF